MLTGHCYRQYYDSSYAAIAATVSCSEAVAHAGAHEVRDGKLRRMRVYDDGAAVMRQLGLVPE